MQYIHARNISAYFILFAFPHTYIKSQSTYWSGYQFNIKQVPSNGVLTFPLILKVACPGNCMHYIESCLSISPFCFKCHRFYLEFLLLITIKNMCLLYLLHRDPRFKLFGDLDFYTNLIIKNELTLLSIWGWSWGRSWIWIPPQKNIPVSGQISYVVSTPSLVTVWPFSMPPKIKQSFQWPTIWQLNAYQQRYTQM